jgi:hypothetical protein
LVLRVPAEPVYTYVSAPHRGVSNLESRIQRLHLDTLRLARVVPHLGLPVRGPMRRHALRKSKASPGPWGPGLLGPIREAHGLILRNLESLMNRQDGLWSPTIPDIAARWSYNWFAELVLRVFSHYFGHRTHCQRPRGPMRPENCRKSTPPRGLPDSRLRPKFRRPEGCIRCICTDPDSRLRPKFLRSERGERLGPPVCKRKETRGGSKPAPGNGSLAVPHPTAENLALGSVCLGASSWRAVEKGTKRLGLRGFGPKGCNL